ncbi:uncharacterized protein LOC111400651 [Olea europaea var. sylvestris]|uniref:uncharacterized protein LOC111400651 n=1 Tax=Olea europaea var. sylvestris TaxID=158386 RepID=UPI000C1CF726|nr:uncharacterized protein LOC111400651 [Olea europaea var. sylvestris]
MTKRSFLAKGHRAKEVLELVHFDVCGPMNTPVRKTAAYVLNLVPSKSVPKTLLELWNGLKPSLRYIRIWGCPAHVLKGKAEKLESRSEICLFVGYPKGTRGYYFYSPLDREVFVSTNSTFLEDKYINERQSKSKVVLEELSGSNSTTSIPETQSHDRQPLVSDIPKQCV